MRSAERFTTGEINLNNICENEASRTLISEAITKHGASISVEPGIKISENIAFLIRVTTSSHYGSAFKVTGNNSFGFILKNKEAVVKEVPQ